LVFKKNCRLRWRTKKHTTERRDTVAPLVLSYERIVGNTFYISINAPRRPRPRDLLDVKPPPANPEKIKVEK